MMEGLGRGMMSNTGVGPFFEDVASAVQPLAKSRSQ
jgi:hypothetical protein